MARSKPQTQPEPPKVEVMCKQCEQRGLLGVVIFTYSTAHKVITLLHRGCRPEFMKREA